MSKSTLFILITAVPVAIGIITLIFPPSLDIKGSTRKKLTKTGIICIVVSILAGLFSYVMFNIEETEATAQNKKTDSLENLASKFRTRNEEGMTFIKKMLQEKFGIAYDRSANNFYINNPVTYRQQLNNYVVPDTTIEATIVEPSKKTEDVRQPENKPGNSGIPEPQPPRTTKYQPELLPELVKTGGFAGYTEFFGRCVFVNKTGHTLKLYLNENKRNSGGTVPSKVVIPAGDENESVDLFIGHNPPKEPSLVGTVADYEFYFATTESIPQQYGTISVKIKAGYQHKVEITKQNLALSPSGEKNNNFLRN